MNAQRFLSPDLWEQTLGAIQDYVRALEARGAAFEATNNAAERAIRPGMLWLKGSLGTQSSQGSRFVEVIMTVVATLKQQHRNVLDYVTAVRGGAPG